MRQAFVDEIPPAEAEVGKHLRQVAESVVLLAEHLSADDREFIRGVYHHGMRVSAMARAMNRPITNAHRRLRRLARRIHSPLFMFVLRRRDQWTDDSRSVAGAMVLRGRTQRQAAAELGMSLHRVRQEIDRVHNLFEDESQRRDRAEREFGI